MNKARGTFILASLITLIAWPDLSDAQVDEAYEQLQQANKLASAGAISRSIPVFKKAIELAPGQIPQAYFNLAEVYRARGSCEDAALPYRAYAVYAGTSEAQKEVARAMRRCNTTGWQTLTLQLKPEGARAKIAGYLWPAKKQVTVLLPRGEYKIAVEAVDHHPDEFTIELADEDVTRSVELEKMKFKGKIQVNAPEGSRIRIFAGPSDKTEIVADEAKPGEAVEVSEGRHFVEVTRDGFERWIRNVSVKRDETSEVKVAMTPLKPSEIR